MSDESVRKAKQEYEIDPTPESAGKLLGHQAKSGTASNVVYVVVSTAYEYDDNYYNSYGGVSLGRAFVRKERAQELCDALNVGEMLEVDLHEYLYDNEMFGEDIDGKSPAEFFQGLGIVFDQDNRDGLRLLQDQLKELEHSTLVKIFNASRLRFNRVEEVNVEDGLCGEV